MPQLCFIIGDSFFHYPVFGKPFNKSGIIGFVPRALVIKVYVWKDRQFKLVIITFSEKKEYTMDSAFICR